MILFNFLVYNQLKNQKIYDMIHKLIDLVDLKK